MASPRNFTGCNVQLKPAQGTEDVVGTLPVHVDGLNSISRWRLAPDEIAKIVETGDIWVSVMVGQGMQPPIRVSAYPLMEFRDENGQIVGGYDPDTDEINKPTRIVHTVETFD